MGIDKEVVDAIKLAANNFDQSEQLTTRLVGWINDLSDNKSSLEEKDEVERRIESIFASIKENEE